MTLLEWMQFTEINPDGALCVSVGSDGRNIDKDTLMSVSYKTKGKAGTIYVEGADPVKTQHITGVEPEKYFENAVGLPRAEELLESLLDDAEFVVVYWAQFTHAWLMKYFAELFASKPVLDITLYAKLLDKPERIPSNIMDISTLADRLPAATCDVKGAYGFDAICGRQQIPHREGPALEQKAEYLWALYKVLLTA